MSKGKIEFVTLNARDGLKQEVWTKLESKSVKPAADLTNQKELTIFNNISVHKRMQEYDHFFAYTKVFPLWDQRKIRDNRQFLPDVHENTFQQEKRKTVPVLTSLDYGRPCLRNVDFSEDRFKRRAEMQSLLRKNGIMPPIEKDTTLALT